MVPISRTTSANEHPQPLEPRAARLRRAARRRAAAAKKAYPSVTGSWERPCGGTGLLSTPARGRSAARRVGTIRSRRARPASAFARARARASAGQQ